MAKDFLQDSGFVASAIGNPQMDPDYDSRWYLEKPAKSAADVGAVAF
jgi:hypothetical protein